MTVLLIDRNLMHINALSVQKYVALVIIITQTNYNFVTGFTLTFGIYGVCECVRACVRACMRACVRACVCVSE